MFTSSLTSVDTAAHQPNAPYLLTQIQLKPRSYKAISHSVINPGRKLQLANIGLQQHPAVFHERSVYEFAYSYYRHHWQLQWL